MRLEIPEQWTDDCWQIESVRDAATTTGNRRVVTSWVRMARRGRTADLRLEWDDARRPPVVQLLTRAWLEQLPVLIVAEDDQPCEASAGSAGSVG
jgi:hypothetical protein